MKDEDTFVQLSQDPTTLFQSKLKSILQEVVSMGAITQKLADKLFVTDPVVLILHSLPKIHKQVFSPPVRPIVAGIGSLGERLGKWIDCHLQPMVAMLPGFIKDTNPLVSGIEGLGWTEDSSCLACDVVALYTSIPHGIALPSL